MTLKFRTAYLQPRFDFDTAKNEPLEFGHVKFGWILEIGGIKNPIQLPREINLNYEAK